MTIASELTKLNTNLTNSYTAVSGKGGTLPASQNFDNLATAISSIPSGGGEDIGVPREIVNNTYQMPSSNFNYVLPAGAKNLGNYVLFGAFYASSGIVSANMDALETCNSTSALQSCFLLCNNLITASFASLYQILGANALNTAFAYATKIENIYFNSLTSSSFGSVKSQFTNMMQGTGSTVTHTIHFPSNLESTIQTLTGYPLFGGTSGKVVCAFDLPATS